MSTDASNHTDLLRWWHQYQARALNQEVDLVRNHVLQDMFAIRRRVELFCQTPPVGKEFSFETHLAELKNVHKLLENLCDRLESPYVEDSLPLALQHAAQFWQSHLALHLKLPQTWGLEPVEHTRLLVLFIENLWQQLATATPPPTHCEVVLGHGAEIRELTIEATYPDALAPTFLSQISRLLLPFLETFQVLTDGDFDQSLQPRKLVWKLRWHAQVISP